MRPRAFLVLAIAVSGLALLGGAHAEPPRSAPPEVAQATVQAPTLSDLTEELQRIQIRIAQGDRAAYPDQINQLKAIAALIAAAKPQTWRDKREADSLVIYILSGGALADVVPLLKNDSLLESERALARGALAYITNHETEALDLLTKEDPKTLDARLAGQVAFARSVLETKHDPKAAISLLDWARLLSPGNLVEEAALRREISLVAETRDTSRVALLTRQYATRFAASLFAADFFQELARSIARIGLADTPTNYQLLSTAAATLPPDGRRAFLMSLAQAAIVNGRFDAASAAASEALLGAPLDGPDDARAHLYLDAARILSEGYDAAAADLQRLAGSKLDRSDASLLASVRSVAAQLRTTPSLGAVEAQGDALRKEKPAGASVTIDAAEQALKRTTRFADGPAP